MKNHHCVLDHKLASQIVAALEAGGLNENLAHEILKKKELIVPMVIAVARQPEAWRDSPPQILLNIQPDISWQELCKKNEGRLRVNWNQLKDKKLREEKTEGGLYSVNLLALESPELFNASLKKQLSRAKKWGFDVPNAITAVSVMLELQKTKVCLSGRSFRTSSKGKDGRSVEVKITKNGPLISSILADDDSAEATGLFVLTRKMKTPA